MFDDNSDDAARPRHRRAQAAPDRVPGRHPQGSDPLARDPLRLYRLFLPRAANSRPSLSIFRCCSLWLGVSLDLGDHLVTMGLLYDRGISGWVGPMITPKIGHRGISIAGLRHRFRLACWWRRRRSTPATSGVLPFACAAMLWGHYWDASNCMTIPTVVARPEYRGTASGFAYMFVKAAVLFGHLPVPLPVHRHRPGQCHAVRGRSFR